MVSVYARNDSPNQKVLRRVSSSITLAAGGMTDDADISELEMLPNGGHAFKPHGTAYRRDRAKAMQACELS